MWASVSFRPGTLADVETIAALAIQVFLETYAGTGVEPELAAEAFAEYGVEAFAARLREPQRWFLLARRGRCLVGFAEVRAGAWPIPGGLGVGSELVRLYVHPAARRQGIGRALLERVEVWAQDRAQDRAKLSARTDEPGPCLWLQAWEGNDRALAFYRALGYGVVGRTSYTFRERHYTNLVLSPEPRSGAAPWDGPGET